MEELQQGGWLELCAYLCGGGHVCVVCVCVRMAFALCMCCVHGVVYVVWVQVSIHTRKWTVTLCTLHSALS